MNTHLSMFYADYMPTLYFLLTPIPINSYVDIKSTLFEIIINQGLRGGWKKKIRNAKWLLAENAAPLLKYFEKFL